ncbi:hypothetical protein J4536_23515, partial [Escherichia coli]|nr:hypothetical protein [Escherichia coli]
FFFFFVFFFFTLVLMFWYFIFSVFFFKAKTAYGIGVPSVGPEICIRDSHIVIISTLRLDKLHVLGKGEQCWPIRAPRSIRWKKPSNRWDANRTR